MVRALEEAEAAGTPRLIDPECAELTAGQVGNHQAGFLSFQPLYDWITRLEPDLFEALPAAPVLELLED